MYKKIVIATLCMLSFQSYSGQFSAVLGALRGENRFVQNSQLQYPKSHAEAEVQIQDFRKKFDVINEKTQKKICPNIVFSFMRKH